MSPSGLNNRRGSMSFCADFVYVNFCKSVSENSSEALALNHISVFFKKTFSLSIFQSPRFTESRGGIHERQFSENLEIFVKYYS
jgi:hypothetical protein